MADLYKEDYNDGYYHLGADIEKYPDAVIYVIMSQRGPGKTYSALRYGLRTNQQLIYMKRTKEDVDLIANEGMSMSPYEPLNRDFDIDIKPRHISKGIAGFFRGDADVNSKPVSYCLALNALKTIKGMDLTTADLMVLDEFVPTLGDIQVRRTEGQLLLDTYMTASRDREMRGRPPLKLVLMSNTEQLACPIMDELELVDPTTELIMSGESYLYLEDRKILIHYIRPQEYEVTSKAQDMGMALCMRGTSWAARAFGGDFSGKGNDLSSVLVSKSLKGFTCEAEVIYKRKPFWVYKNRATGEWRACRVPHSAKKVMDLETDQGIRNFYALATNINIGLFHGRFTADSYSIYNVCANFNKVLK